MAIYDAFLNNLINLKYYGILHQDAREIIMFKEITLTVYHLTKTSFRDHETKDTRTYNIFFLITLEEDGGDKVSLFNKHKLPVKQISKEGLKMSEEELEKALDAFVKKNFLAHEREKISATIAGSNIIDPRLLDKDEEGK